MKIKAKMGWWCSYRDVSDHDCFRRKCEIAEVELAVNQRGEHKIIVDGNYRENSDWFFQAEGVSNRAFLAIKVSITTEPDNVRYYAFEKTTKTKDGGWCWLCQHSKKNEEEEMTTYAETFLNGTVPAVWSAQKFHIEMNQRPDTDAAEHSCCFSGTSVTAGRCVILT